MLTTPINMLVAVRLPGMYELLGNAADRMRPIWITHPDAGSVLTAGEKYTVKWGTSPKIAAMMEKKGVKMEDQVVSRASSRPSILTVAVFAGGDWVGTGWSK